MYWVIFVTLVSNKWQSNESLICMWKTSFYMGNTTLVFMIVVFLIKCSWKFVLSHIRCVVISNCKLRTTPEQQPHFGIIRNIACVLIHTLTLHNSDLFFQLSLHEVLKTFSWSFKYCCKSWCLTKYLIYVFRKQMRKQSHSSTTSSTSCDTSWPTDFLAVWQVFVCKHWKAHCNIFSGLKYNMNLMYDMHFALFQKFIEKAFRFSANLGGR